MLPYSSEEVVVLRSTCDIMTTRCLFCRNKNDMGIAQRLRSRIRHTQTSLMNTAKLMSGNRFTAPYHTPFQVVLETETYSLRHYTSSRNPSGSCVLLVPPLMVTAEIYDMAPDLSAVLWLLAQGHDVWGVDFGSPHATPQGLEKTLTDHVVAVSSAVDELVKQRGGSVHLIGYSQGGMFIYQAAAFRRCKDIASLITMGSPVDILRNFPIPVHSGVLSNLLHAAEEWVRVPLESLPFLPGWITSWGFKLLSPRQELRHLLMMLRFLDDEEALKKLEPTRRFLGGEGFIAWPGPALRTFVDDFVVHNRMMSGGFVIAGQTVSLADLSVPILYFRGSRDDFARPRSVSAIERVVPHDEVFGRTIDAGHLGLVVGTRAREEVWTTVDKWLDYRDRSGPKPMSIGRLLPIGHSPHPTPNQDAKAADSAGMSRPESDQEAETDPLNMRVLSAAPRALWRKAGDIALDVTSGARWLRWQLPRVVDLLRFWDSAPMSMAATLAAQAKAIPDRTFFLWEGRAYSYAAADRRVTQIAAALYASGVRTGQTVGLLMDNHPDCLTALVALSRLGAVPALLNPSTRGAALRHALDVTKVRDLIALPWRWQGLSAQARLLLSRLGLGGLTEDHVGLRRPARYPLAVAALGTAALAAVFHAAKPAKELGPPQVTQEAPPPAEPKWRTEAIGDRYRVIAELGESKGQVEVPPSSRVFIRWMEEKQKQQTDIADWCPYNEETHNGIVYVRVCGGEFTMGSADSEREAYDNEKPAHRVKLDDYWIGKYEVSNAEYRLHDAAQKSHYDRDDQPVNLVNWNEAKAFCEAQGGRLPTEAEWEYAARGRDGRKYPWGDDAPDRTLAVVAIKDGKVNPQEPEAVTSHPEGKGPFGALHQAGNVWEWVADCYSPYPKSDSVLVNPRVETADCQERVLRGNSFVRVSWRLRSAYRDGFQRGLRDLDVGFRCVRGVSRQP